MQDKKNAIISVTLIVSLVVCTILYNLYSQYLKERKEESIKVYFDYQIKQLNKNIEDAKLSSLALAIILSKNDAIQECFTSNDRTKCLQDVEEIINTFGTVSVYKNLRLHLHTKDLRSYVRSWDTKLYGDKLTHFRHLISESAKQKRPMTGIEVGMAGVKIRSISGVMVGEQNVGTIEVMLDFEYMGEFFKEQGIDLFVLLDKDQAISKQGIRNANLLSKYYIENLNTANLNILEILRDIDFDQNDFIRYKKHYFSVVPLMDASSKRIGYYVLHINKDEKERNLSQNYIPDNEFLF
ncbi:hypothetical protein CCAL9344_07470 [Campylobacter sp. RM9344]|uniref:Double Cache domain-containing protein n=1 Tax=Campylobacter californiensis TaxID=1032243 RepID=A0AAW3ZWT4_9BACT|nr:MULTISPECIES: cache domain-containing protein [unclassified Campylobacter]MBE2985266.1 hypothetical protein [Campylobacter sp. RM6883]MBE2995923.1 hypothetical protein [Campylobacter sp. RM6913]MBE3030020.1 hypothetical protein [Campylobacter sp. RM9344]MBE3608791.1 hypothetical protein [Campylobacter sp. RM9337]QCD51266.1 hypothetical protein CCAL_1382 [Campylobacter sp. RM6914]